MDVVREPAALGDLADAVLVPTMGALHAGHLALVRRAVEVPGPVVVSIFVNPTQFGPGEDFERYPRDPDADLAAAAAAGADAVFLPDVETMYPPDRPVPVPPLPAVATEPGLEDACRPEHFAGVCQVVARLFDLVRPAAAVFGEKDYQQLLVVRAMVRDEAPRWGGLDVVAHPTVREPDGLALSSRNAYLTDAERPRALGLSRALHAAATEPDPGAAEAVMARVLDDHGLRADYAVVRDAETLEPLAAAVRPRRGLIAAHLGAVRLIDNEALPGG
ncbi:MAG: pantoate--beta-alanine ligase [Planctomycetota bacterium]|jgi:pantoate--beta-alanine ligase